MTRTRAADQYSTHVRKREIADSTRYVNPRVCARLRFIVYAGLIMRVTVKTDETGRRGRDDIARKETRGSRQMRIMHAPIESRIQALTRNNEQRLFVSVT